MDPTFRIGHTMRVRDALAAGLTRDQIRGPGWEHLSHGLVRPAADPLDPTSARVGEALGLMMPGCLIGGWAALWLQGNRSFDGRQPGSDIRPVLVHCSPGTQLRRRPSVTPSRGLVHVEEFDEHDGLAVVTMARAALDEARLARGLDAAVAAIDMAVSTVTGAPHTTLGAVERVAARHPKARGIVQVRRALALASARSASPLETRTRMLAVRDLSMRGLLANVPVFTLGGELLGIADLLDPSLGLVFETDGDHHRDDVQHTDDNRREERFEHAGLIVCRVTGLDHRDRRGTVERMARARLAARRDRPQGWTLDQPDWWHTWERGRRWR